MTTKSRGTQILVVLALANLVGYAARNALLAVYPTLKSRYGIGDGEIGLLQTVFMVPHAVATLPFGWAGDRFDRRRVIAVGLALTAAAGAVGAIGSSYTAFATSRAFVGLGAAAVVPVANSILGQVFEGPLKASRMSIFNLGLFLGGVLGFAGRRALGFPVVVVALAAPGVVLSALLWTLPVPPPRGEAVELAAGGTGYLVAMTRRFAADAGRLLRIRTLRWIIVSTTAMAFAAGGYGAWLVEFLKRDKGMGNEEAASSLFAMALCGALPGILVGGRVADYLRRHTERGRLWTIVIGMTATIPFATLAIELPNSPALYAVGVATMFFVNWYHAPMAASVDDLAPPGLTVAAQGLVIFTMHLLGTAPASWIVGVVSERSNLHDAMWVPTAGLVVAAACMTVATRTFAADVRAHGTARQASL